MPVRKFFLDKEDLKKKEPGKKSRKKSSPQKQKVEKPLNCSSCGLYKYCKSPKIEKFGQGQKKILLIGLCPGKTEDEEGIPFVGKSGNLLKETFSKFGIDINRDCVRTNVAKCYPGKNKKGQDIKPSDFQISCCRKFLIEDIEEVKPDLIICFGTEAIQSILQPETLTKFSATTVHGFTFPSHQYNCWVGCSFHPSYILRSQDNEVNHKGMFKYDIGKILDHLEKPLPAPLKYDNGEHELIIDCDDAVDIIHEMCSSQDPTSYDYETNSLSPYKDDAKILTVSFTNDTGSAIFIPFEHVDPETKFEWTEDELTRIYEAWKCFLRSKIPKVIQNTNMEILWDQEYFGVFTNNVIHDTMIGAHVLYNSMNSTNLGFQTFLYTGAEYKEMVDKENLENEPLLKIMDYNCLDSRYTLLSYQNQNRDLGKNERLNEFFKMYQAPMVNLCRMSHRGIPIDLEMMSKFKEEYLEKEKDIKEIISGDEKVRKFEEKNKKTFNPDSPPQLGIILYDLYGAKPLKYGKDTKEGKKGKPSVDEQSLIHINKTTDIKGVKELTTNILTFRKITGFLERIDNFERHTDSESKIHSLFGLNTAVTYRSNAKDPPTHNIYKHDEELFQFRKCLKPYPGHVMLEGDYGGQEVRGIAMASGDKELIRQINDGIDTHQKWAAMCFDIPLDDFIALPNYKELRYNGKNCFVFPTFYGSKPPAIIKHEPFQKANISQDHIEKCQNMFWEEFPGVRKWQKDVVDFYNKNGYMQAMSGFICPGPLTIYYLYNSPIQGPSFHLLLKALKTIDEIMVEKKMKSKIILEVHDCINSSADPSEVPEIIEISNEIMTSKMFDWQRDVPLLVEWEIGSDYYNLSKGLKEIGVTQEKNEFLCFKTNSAGDVYTLWTGEDQEETERNAENIAKAMECEYIGFV